MQQLIKEERKEKEEGRRVVGLAGLPLGLAGGHRWVSPADPRFVCLFFYRPWVSLPLLAIAVPCHHSEPRHLATTHLTTSQRSATETRLGLVGRGFGFFLVFRMIKSQKGFTSPLGSSFEVLEMNFVALELIFEALETIF
jgi:hypothetical protein